MKVQGLGTVHRILKDLHENDISLFVCSGHSVLHFHIRHKADYTGGSQLINHCIDCRYCAKYWDTDQMKQCRPRSAV